MKRVTVLVLLGMSAGAQAHDEPGAEAQAERSRTTAREVLDRAASALGGLPALRAIDTVRYRAEGQVWERLQQLTPSSPGEADAGTHQLHVLLDLRNERMLAELHENAAGMERNNTTVLSAGSAQSYNHRARFVLPVALAQARQQFASYTRRLPQLLLRDALANPDALRYLGREDLAGRAHDVIGYSVSPEEQLSLYVDTTSHLLSKHTSAIDDPLAGPAASEFSFVDYARTGAHLVPRTWITREAEQVTARLEVSVEVAPAVSESSFVGPEGYVHVEPPPPPEARAEQLADGVFAMRNVARADFHSLAVAFRDHILVVEAPWSSAGADRLIARVKEAIPGKPIRYVAITHHHGDHVGGVRSFIAEGATVITTPGNRDFIESVARAPLEDRLAESPRKPDFLLVRNGRHVLSDGTRTVELIDIGPNPHTREMLVAYLPKERLMFEADMFLMPNSPRPLGPAQATTRSFAQRMRELGLEVDRFVATHGRMSTADDLAAAIRGPQ